MAKPVGTCGHCRLPIEDSDLVVLFEDGRLLHVGCWRVSDSATRPSVEWPGSALAEIDRRFPPQTRRTAQSGGSANGRPRPTMLRAVTAPPARRWSRSCERWPRGWAVSLP